MVPINTDAVPKHHLRVRRNLKSIEVTYDTSEMTTRLYCFGSTDENGNELNIMSVNPTGKPYIDNFEYFYDLGYTDEDIEAHPELFIKTNIWRDDNYYLVNDLFEDGKKELAKVSVPKVDITVDAIQYDGDLESLQIGDCIRVTDEDIGADFMCNLTKKTRNYSEAHVVQVEITNNADYRNVISELFSSVSTMSQVVTNGGTIIGSAISGIHTDQIYDLAAKYASIEYLDAHYIDAESIASVYATIESLTAYKADIQELVTESLEAVNAQIENLEATKLSAEEAELMYANIDFTNIGLAAIEEFFAKSGMIENIVVGEGTITGKLVGVTISGDLIEGNTIKADKLVVKGEDGLYYKLNVSGETVEAQQTDENSLNGSVIKAKSITATKISVSDLVAFDATIGGFHITDDSIYSGVKESATNTTRGVYMDDDGQFSAGDATNFFKYYKDEDGNYKLEISATSIRFGSEGTDLETALGDISVDAVEVGGRNLAIGTSDEWSEWWTPGAGDPDLVHVFSYAYLPVDKSVGDLYTVSLDVEWTKFTPSADGTFYLGFKGDVDDAYTVENFLLKDFPVLSSESLAEAGTKHITMTVSVETEPQCTANKFGIGMECDFSDGTGQVRIKSLKVEKGNIPTDWTPAPEDVEQSISDTTNNLQQTIIDSNTEVISNCEEIILQALQNYVETGDYEEYKATIETELSVMAGQIEMNFSTVTSQITDVDGDVQEKFTELYKYIHFVDGDIILGSSENAITLTIENDMISFKKNGEQFGWWDGVDFHTGNIVVELNERAQFGNFAFVPRSDGSLSFLKVR